MNAETEKKLNDLLLWSDPDARELLEETAQKYQIKMEAVAEVLAWMRTVQSKGDKHGGLNKELENIFDNPTLWEQE